MSSTAACPAWHVSQPLCTQATGLFYQPARCLVPAPARMSQLEAPGCDKTRLRDGERDETYWGGELTGSTMGRSGFIVAVWDVEGLVHRDVKYQRKNLCCCSQNSLFYGKRLRGIRLKPKQFLMDH